MSELLKPPVKPNVAPGLAATMSSPFPNMAMSDKVAVVPKPKLTIAQEDPPIEPVYSMSPLALKHGLASVLAAIGIGI